MGTYVPSTPVIEYADMAGRLVLSIVAGAIVGLERERRERAAGLRTHILVSLGAAAFTIISAYGFNDWFHQVEVPDRVPAPPKDPSRIAAQIVSGIGFLGGGVILRSGLNVKGLTTAATVWATGAIGMAIGAGMHVMGIATAVAILFVLVTMRWVNNLISEKYHSDAVYIRVKAQGYNAIDRVVESLRAKTVNMHTVTVESPESDDIIDIFRCDADLAPGIDRADLVRELMAIDGVRAARVKPSERVGG